MLGASVKWEVGVLSWCCDGGQIWGHTCVLTQQDTASTDGTFRAVMGTLAVAVGVFRQLLCRHGYRRDRQAGRQADRPASHGSSEGLLVYNHPPGRNVRGTLSRCLHSFSRKGCSSVSSSSLPQGIKGSDRTFNAASQGIIRQFQLLCDNGCN